MRTPVLPRYSPRTLFIAEYICLLLMSLFFTYKISKLADIIYYNDKCRLGYMNIVPYILYNQARFCSINYQASVYTMIYFALSLIVLIIFHILYRNTSSTQRKNIPFRFRIGTKAAFWTIFLVWVFGLKGARGDWEGLTTNNYFLYAWTCLLLALSHFLAMYFRTESRV